VSRGYKRRRRPARVVRDEAYFLRKARERALLVAILKITFIAALFLAVSALALRWGYRALSKHESARLVTMAESFLKEGKLKEANMSLDTALRVYPSNTQALVMRARLAYSQNEGSDTIASFDQLFAARRLSISDLRPYARLAATHGRLDFAQRLADAPDPRFDPALSHVIHADLLALRGKYSDAEQELRAGLKVDTVDTAHIALIQFLSARDESDATRKEVFSLLKDLSSRNSAVGAEAMADALNNPGLIPAGEQAEWIKLLRAHPRVSPQMLLVADAASVRMDPASRPAVTEALITRLSHASLDERMLGARWLIAEKEPEMVFTLISRDQAFTNKESFHLWLTACQLCSRWDDILAALEVPSNPLSSLTLQLLRAETLSKAGRSAEAHAAFQAIWAREGNRQPGCYEVIDCLAALPNNVEKELFTECFSKLLSDTATAWPALEQVVATLRVQRDATLIRQIYSLAAASPVLANNPVVLNAIAYLDLIINQSADPSTFASMLSRITSNPNEISFRATYALALLLSGQKGEALLQLQKLQTVDPARLTSDQLAIMAGILAQNGDQILSRRIQTAIPKQTLSEQEWLLLNKNMASLGAPASPSSQSSPATADIPIQTISNAKPRLFEGSSTNSSISPGR